MQNPRFILLTAIVLSVLYNSTLIANPIPQTFSDCFSENYSFKCANPTEFLQNMGIDIHQNIISFKNLQKISKLKRGHNKGTFYKDQNGVEYFVKECAIVNEFIGSRLLNLIMGTECTPIVKLLLEKKGTASLKLSNFLRKKDIDLKNKEIIDEVPLAIAMDFIGLCDRNLKNMGYILLPSNEYKSARVDFDTGLRFHDHRWQGIFDFQKDEHLSLKHLYVSIKNFPIENVINAIQKIIEIPDEKFVMTILECWATLHKVGHSIPLEKIILLGQQIIERKNAFLKAQLELKIIPKDDLAEFKRKIKNTEKLSSENKHLKKEKEKLLEEIKNLKAQKNKIPVK